MTETQYNILSENNTSTVVAHYERPAMVADEGYQTEADLERSLIEQLQRQGMSMPRYTMRRNSSPTCARNWRS
jgi:hypothetical protein